MHPLGRRRGHRRRRADVGAHAADCRFLRASGPSSGHGQRRRSPRSGRAGNGSGIFRSAPSSPATGISSTVPEAPAETGDTGDTGDTAGDADPPSVSGVTSVSTSGDSEREQQSASGVMAVIEDAQRPADNRPTAHGGGSWCYRGSRQHAAGTGSPLPARFRLPLVLAPPNAPPRRGPGARHHHSAMWEFTNRQHVAQKPPQAIIGTIWAPVRGCSAPDTYRRWPGTSHFDVLLVHGLSISRARAAICAQYTNVAFGATIVTSRRSRGAEVHPGQVAGGVPESLPLAA